MSRTPVNESIFSPEIWINTVQYGIVAEDASDPAIVSTTNELGAEAPAEEVVVETETQEVAAEVDKRPPWFVKRIDEVTAKRHEEAARADKAEGQVRELKTLIQGFLNSGATPAQAAAAAGVGEEAAEQARQQRAPLTDADIDALVEKKAAEKIQAEEQGRLVAEFNERCNSVKAIGDKEYPDFEVAVTKLKAAGVTDYIFLDAVTAFDEAPQLIHHLGQNPDDAIRIRKMSAPRMAAELAKLATKMPELPSKAAKAAKPASNAPAPVTRIGGTGTPGAPSLDDPNIDMATWVKLRQEQETARRSH